MDKPIFITLLWFMAGVIFGYITAPLTNYAVYYLVYKLGNRLLGWLEEKGIIK